MKGFLSLFFFFVGLENITMCGRRRSELETTFTFSFPSLFTLSDSVCRDSLLNSSAGERLTFMESLMEPRRWRANVPVTSRPRPPPPPPPPLLLLLPERGASPSPFRCRTLPFQIQHQRHTAKFTRDVTERPPEQEAAHNDSLRNVPTNRNQTTVLGFCQTADIKR